MTNVQAANAFQINLKQVENNMYLNTAEGAKDFILTVFTIVMEGTPVDTGVAKANWNLSINSIDNTFKKSRKNADSTLARGIQGAERFVIGDTTYITNHTAYIYALESGATPSKKAPPGWVSLAVEQAKKGFI